MIERHEAIILRDHVLSAIKSLNQAYMLAVGKLDEATLQNMKRCIGSCIGEIDVELLSEIYRLYPELDDLLEKQQLI